jgi:hypothetical protein
MHKYIIDIGQVWAPQLFYTYAYQYNHAHRLRLVKLLRVELSRSFWIQVTVSLLKLPHGGFRSEAAVA